MSLDHWNVRRPAVLDEVRDFLNNPPDDLAGIKFDASERSGHHSATIQYDIYVHASARGVAMDQKCGCSRINTDLYTAWWVLNELEAKPDRPDVGPFDTLVEAARYSVAVQRLAGAQFDPAEPQPVSELSTR